MCAAFLLALSHNVAIPGRIDTNDDGADVHMSAADSEAIIEWIEDIETATSWWLRTPEVMEALRWQVGPMGVCWICAGSALYLGVG